MSLPFVFPAYFGTRLIAALAVSLIALAASTPGEARDLVGPANVISADTIEIDGTRIRLWGVQGPDPGQICVKEEEEWECGQRAADYLQEVIGGQPVSCEEKVQGFDAPLVALCVVGRTDLALRMALAGYAVARRDQSDAYVELEGVANRQRRGLWSGDFMLPWGHRDTDNVP